jgi:hypothetical protein
MVSAVSRKAAAYLLMLTSFGFVARLLFEKTPFWLWTPSMIGFVALTKWRDFILQTVGPRMEHVYSLLLGSAMVIVSLTVILTGGAVPHRLWGLFGLAIGIA